MDHKKPNYAVEFSKFPEEHLFIKTKLDFNGSSLLLDSIVLRPQDITALKEFLKNYD